MIIFNVGNILSILRYLPIFSGHPSTRISFLVPFFLITTCMYGIDKVFHTNFKMDMKGLRLNIFSVALFIILSIYFFITKGSNSENWIVYYVVFSMISLFLAIFSIVTIYNDKLLLAIVENRRNQIILMGLLAIILIFLPTLRGLLLNSNFRSFRIIFSYYYSSIIIIWLAIIIIFSVLFWLKKYSKIP